MTFSVKVSGSIAAVTRDLDNQARRVIPRTAAQALNYAGGKVQTISVKEIATDFGIPPSALTGKLSGPEGARRRRGKRLFMKQKANVKRLSVQILALVYPLLSSAVGTPKQANNYGGSFSGRYFFRGGFVRQTKSGHKAVFKRQGSTRPVGAGARGRPAARGALPIDEQTVRIEPKASTIIGNVVKTKARVLFSREFERLLRVKLRGK